MDRTWLRLVYVEDGAFLCAPKCENCDGWATDVTGVWVIEDAKGDGFVKGDGFICDDCARPHAPDLVLAREVANSSHALVSARETAEQAARDLVRPVKF